MCWVDRERGERERERERVATGCVVFFVTSLLILKLQVIYILCGGYVGLVLLLWSHPDNSLKIHLSSFHFRPLKINYLFAVLLSGTFACRWVVHFHYFEISSFSSHYLPSYSHSKQPNSILPCAYHNITDFTSCWLASTVYEWSRALVGLWCTTTFPVVSDFHWHLYLLAIPPVHEKILKFRVPLSVPPLLYQTCQKVWLSGLDVKNRRLLYLAAHMNQILMPPALPIQHMPIFIWASI